MVRRAATSWAPVTGLSAQLGVATGDRRRGGDRLEAPVPAARARDAGPDGQVSDLRGLAAVPGHQVPPGDDRGGDPGADGHEHQVLRADPRAEPVLGHAAGGDVVGDPHRQPPLGAEGPDELEVAPPDVGAVRRDAGLAVDEARDDDARADHRRVGPLREQGAADLGDRVACAATLWCGPMLGGHHGSRAVDQLRLDGRAADVDGEGEIVIVAHRARLARVGPRWAHLAVSGTCPCDTEPSSRRWKMMYTTSTGTTVMTTAANSAPKSTA